MFIVRPIPYLWFYQFLSKTFAMAFDVFTSAPILFFLLGVFSRLVKSDLEIPYPLPKFFSLYVMSAIGVQGGVHLTRSPFEYHYLKIFLVGILGSFGVAYLAYYVFRRFTSKANAVALSASYGSISAVTFITGTALLSRLQIPYGPYMIAVMAFMESPAILMAMFFYLKDFHEEPKSLSTIIKHSITNNSIVVLLGSFLIGTLLSNEGWNKISPFYEGLFQGLLTFFLLDLGLAVAKRFEDLKKAPFSLFCSTLAFQVSMALVAFFVGVFLKFSQGDTFLLMLLFGSASYIAAPAAMRTAVPEANPSLYLSLAMGITFPFNILIGIPFYLWIVQQYGG
ncbi:MAG: sodium-dependent bicarbonate transport family permease [Chlamydiota bacterium]